MSKSALQLIENYLTNRKQCVKVGTTLSNWQDIYKGVPQGSILGPVLFNIFLNDIFHFTTISTLYNYADENTLAHADDNIDKVQFGLGFNKKYSFGKKIIINLHTLYTRPSTLYFVLSTNGPVQGL
jgi:hypothetical protein